MNHSVCSEFLYYLDRDGNLNCNSAPSNIQKWLEELSLPMEFLRLLQWDWPQKDGFIAHIRIMSSKSIYEDEATETFLAAKFLYCGSAPNGDWFVIDFSSDACIPGFVTHEEWSPFEEPKVDPHPFFQPIARRLDSLLYRAVEDKYIPTDYYAARDFNKFLQDEK